MRIIAIGTNDTPWDVDAYATDAVVTSFVVYSVTDEDFEDYAAGIITADDLKATGTLVPLSIPREYDRDVPLGTPPQDQDELEWLDLRDAEDAAMVERSGQ